MGIFAFQIFADIVISNSRTRSQACNRKSQSVELGVEPAIELTKTLFSCSKLRSLSWTIKYTFKTLKTHQKHYKWITFYHGLPT